MKLLIVSLISGVLLSLCSGCFSYKSTGTRTVVVEDVPATTTTRTVTVLPSGYTTTVVRGTTYYTYNNVYYRSAPGGYVIVPRP